MNQHKTIGIDLAKNSFYLFVLNQFGKPSGKKKLSRGQMLSYMAQQNQSVVAMEACASSHFWGREIVKLGHTVQLLPAQHVKGYLRGQKNDYNDAQAIAEASQHGAIRPVALKSIEQQDEQSFLQMRRHLDIERTRLINHIRGLLAEYGVVFKQGSTQLRNRLPEIIEGVDDAISQRFRALLNRQYARLISIDDELEWYNNQLKQKVKQDDVCQRLITIPGFGPVVSSSMKAWMGDGQQFKRGRDASAALGVVPRQFSTGGRDVLLSISKRGSSYLRSLVVNGARSVVSRAGKKTDPLSLWINRLVATRGFNKATVALANKLIRIAWVIITRNEHYRTQKFNLVTA